jgi:hypothetical protein
MYLQMRLGPAAVTMATAVEVGMEANNNNNNHHHAQEVVQVDELDCRAGLECDHDGVFRSRRIWGGMLILTWLFFPLLFSNGHSRRLAGFGWSKGATMMRAPEAPQDSCCGSWVHFCLITQSLDT